MMIGWCDSREIGGGVGFTAVSGRRAKKDGSGCYFADLEDNWHISTRFRDDGSIEGYE